MKKFVATVLVVGLMAVVAQAGTVNYVFDETVSGTWEVSVEVTPVTGDTAGLSAYGFYVNDTASVSYVENVLFTLSAGGMVGMQLPVAGYIGVNYNAGNMQTVAAAVPGIGISPVSVTSILEGMYPSMALGAKALLGTLPTPAGLGVGDFSQDNAGLYNGDASGFLAPSEITVEVNPIPEPMTVSLLAIGGLFVAFKRKRS